MHLYGTLLSTHWPWTVLGYAIPEEHALNLVKCTYWSTVGPTLPMYCAQLRHPCRACTELSTVFLNGALLGTHCPCTVIGYAIPVGHALTIYSILCSGLAPPIEHWNGNPNCTKCPAQLVKNILTLFLPSHPRASELSPEHSDINRGGFNVFSCSELAVRVITFLFMRLKNRFSSHSIHWAEQKKHCSIDYVD